MTHKTMTIVICLILAQLSSMQAMGSRALLTRIQARQALTRLANTRSFSQSAYTHNQHHEQSHKTHDQTLKFNRKYTPLLACAGTLALGAAGYIGYDQYKEYEREQFYNKYNAQNIDDIVALAEARTFSSFWVRKHIYCCCDEDYKRIIYLLSHNTAAQHYLIDLAVEQINKLDWNKQEMLLRIPKVHAYILNAAIKKLNKLKSNPRKIHKHIKEITPLTLLVQTFSKVYVCRLHQAKLQKNQIYIKRFLELEPETIDYLINTNQEFAKLLQPSQEAFRDDEPCSRY